MGVTEKEREISHSKEQVSQRRVMYLSFLFVTLNARSACTRYFTTFVNNVVFAGSSDKAPKTTVSDLMLRLRDARWVNQ